MLFLARMDVQFPGHLTPAEVRQLTSFEKDYSQTLQTHGTLKAIWRVVGEYANYSLFDVRSNDELHTILSNFPMYTYMNIKVTALATHPNSIQDFSTQMQCD